MLTVSILVAFQWRLAYLRTSLFGSITLILRHTNVVVLEDLLLATLLSVSLVAVANQPAFVLRVSLLFWSVRDETISNIKHWYKQNYLLYYESRFRTIMLCDKFINWLVDIRETLEEFGDDNGYLRWFGDKNEKFLIGGWWWSSTVKKKGEN